MPRPAQRGRPRRPSVVPRDRSHRAPGVRAARWQVFGLAGVTPRADTPAWRFLLAVASRGLSPVLLPSRRCATGTAVVPAHRCGAVPDFHRVPSCFCEPGWTRRTSCASQYVGASANRSTTCRVGVSRTRRLRVGLTQLQPGELLPQQRLHHALGR
jgi:hypothetical protein